MLDKVKKENFNKMWRFGLMHTKKMSRIICLIFLSQVEDMKKNNTLRILHKSLRHFFCLFYFFKVKLVFETFQNYVQKNAEMGHKYYSHAMIVL